MRHPTENKTVSSEEIINQIHDLEDGYAAALKDGENAATLTQIWRNIQALYAELNDRLSRQ